MARLDARGVTFAESLARLDHIKTPTVAISEARFDARQVTGSTSIARLEHVKTPLVVVSPARRDARGSAISRSLARFSIALIQTVRSIARRDARAEAGVVSISRRDARASTGGGAHGSTRRDILTRPGWHIYARDPGAGSETLLGFVAQDADPPTLSDVALADGTWEIEARPSEFFWDQCRTRRVTTVVIAGGEVFSSGLPVIQDLRATVTSGTTYIRWRVAGSYSAGAFRFGLWFSATSPVSTAGAPDASKSYIVGQGDYLALRMQADAEFVAVAAYTDLAQGPSAELELPWSSSPPISPPDQHAQRQ